jgi:hypothetical protein
MESVPGAVATGSQLIDDRGSRARDPVATAPGTDLILKLAHYNLARTLFRQTAIKSKDNAVDDL